MKLIYRPGDKPSTQKTIVFAVQQLLAIMAATIAVPAIVNLKAGATMSISAALFGAGAGTLVYLLFTKFKSPVFLGSSFAFISPMVAAFSGAATMYLGFLGFIIGSILAGLVYVALSFTVKFAGIGWINKLMPPVVIGPTVALIGLSLSSSAVKNVFSYTKDDMPTAFEMTTNVWLSLICALVTLFVVVICSTFGKKMAKLIPFIIGILAGYATALIFTVIGYIAGADALKIIDFEPFRKLVENGVQFETFLALPEFAFIDAFKGFKDLDWSYFATVAVAYVPVAFVVFAEHIADHKNLSSIIEEDLLEDPGLDKTLLGDGVGSMVGAFFGGCPNTTYGESVGCVAITKNASVVTIFVTALMAIGISFVSPFVAFLSSIPACVMGGVCITLYGFIAISGLKMIQKVDFENSANLFTASAILIPGIGGFAMKMGKITITNIACALILGILVNTTLSLIGKKLNKNREETEEENSEE